MGVGPHGFAGVGLREQQENPDVLARYPGCPPVTGSAITCAAMTSRRARLGFIAVLLTVSAGVAWRVQSQRTSPALQGEHHLHTSAQASDTQAPRIDTTPPPGPAPAGMVWVPGGTFWMGCDDCGMPDARPVHLVRVTGFWMDETPVTNQEFERFVRETGYVTIAERPLDPKQFPGVPASKLVPGSAVFVPPASVRSLDNPMQWWQYVGAASWRHPEGQGSSIKGREQHPVVH